MELSNIIGTIAAICLVFGYLPQTIHTIRTRSTDDIALGTFILLAVGSICFAIQGALTGNYPLLITNALSGCMRSIIFAIKMHNDYFGGKKKK